MNDDDNPFSKMLVHAQADLFIKSAAQYVTQATMLLQKAEANRESDLHKSTCYFTAALVIGSMADASKELAKQLLELP